MLLTSQNRGVRVGEQLTAANLLNRLNDLKTRSGAARAVVVLDYLQFIPLLEDKAGGDLETLRKMDPEVRSCDGSTPGSYGTISAP